MMRADKDRDAQQFIDALRENNIEGFLAYKDYLVDKYFQAGSGYHKEKDLGSIFTWEFFKTTIDLKDIKKLLQFELLVEEMAIQSGNDEIYKLHGMIKEARSNLIAVVAYKEFQEFEPYTHITFQLPDKAELKSMDQLIDASRQKTGAKVESFKLAAKELKDMVLIKKDKNGTSYAMYDFDGYKDSKEFHKFKDKFWEKLDVIEAISENINPKVEEQQKLKAPQGPTSLFQSPSSQTSGTPPLSEKNRPRR